MALECIPCSRFASEEFTAVDQFDAWRERISVVFNVEPLAPSVAGGFMARAQAFHLGELVMVNTRFAGQRFIRTPQQARRDWLDHYLVQFYRHGGYVGAIGGEEAAIPAGSVSVLDLARPLDTRATAAECVSLVVPRDVMESVLPDTDGLHGAVLNDGCAGLLGDYLTSLERRLPTLAVAQAPHIVRATCDLIAACVLPSAGNLDRARDALDPLLLGRIRCYIDQRIDAAGAAHEIAPEDICAAMALSRSKLYALFKPCGGVRRYIQHRRLQRIHAALANPAERRSIMILAERYGFGSHAHLSRAFRLHYGYSPSEARHDPGALLRARVVAAATQAQQRHNTPGFDDWVRSLRV